MLRSPVHFCLVVPLLFGQSATSETFDEYCARARSEFADRLEQHAKWCGKKGLRLDRDRTLELVLDLEPNNSFARKGLGYRKKGRDWTPPKRARERVNKKAKPEILEEAAERRQTAVVPFVRGHIEQIENERLSEGQRKELLIEIVRFDPSNAYVAGASLEIRAAAASVLPETLTGRQRRELVDKWLDEAGASAPTPKLVAPTAKERDLGVRFAGAIEVPRVRVLYATTVEEAKKVARAMYETEYLFRSLFPPGLRLPSDTRVFLLEEESDKELFLKNHPSIREPQKKALLAQTVFGIQGTRDIVSWDGDEAHRVDGVVRIALGWMFSYVFKYSSEVGWAYEGMGLVMTRLVVGTRLTWTAGPPTGQDQYQQRSFLLDPDTNWIDEAYQMWYDDRTPDFEELLTKEASELTPEDILAAYAFSAYLIEGQPDRIRDFLSLAGRNVPPAQVTKQVLGWDLGYLRGRVGEWISERF